MPMYDYQCDACGHRFEIRQRFGDDPLTKCPECSSGVRRVIHPTGVIFKGSGWFITDNRQSPPESNGKSGKSEPAEKATEKATAGSSSEDTTPSE